MQAMTPQILLNLLSHGIIKAGLELAAVQRGRGACGAGWSVLSIGSAVHLRPADC